jgi:dimethylargininase
LHLKTAITAPANDLLIANPDWIDLAPFRQLEVLAVPESEPWGANTLPVNGRVWAAASTPGSVELLRSKGLIVDALDISELQKAEAGLTCLSILYGEGSGSSRHGFGNDV